MRYRLRPAAMLGFTLIELLVTVAIVAVLARGVLELTVLSVQRTREHELRFALREIRTAIDAYKQAAAAGQIPIRAGTSGYPPSLAALVEGVPDTRDPSGKGRMHFLRRIPRDPTHMDRETPDAETWGLRSYASSADAPAAGDDVFDVYSLSSATGINGIPYKDW
ncbi:MAG: type II secretion system protein [Rhodocyclales bacterium]|nr:type II secretion system protein [Rhodocyclales bacterium]